MAKGYGSSVHVDLLQIESELAHAMDVHGSEGFVDLQSQDGRALGSYEPFVFMHTSNRSTSSFVRPTFSNTFGMAMVGPTPMIRGAKPAHMFD